MKSIYICLASVLIISVSAHSQNTNADTTRRYGGLFSLNFTQASLSNWAAGGQNSVAGNSIVNYFSNYKKGNNSWDHNVDLAFGLMVQGKDARATKSDDKIDLSTKYGHHLKGSWNASFLLNFRSQ